MEFRQLDCAHAYEQAGQQAGGVAGAWCEVWHAHDGFCKGCFKEALGVASPGASLSSCTCSQPRASPGSAPFSCSAVPAAGAHLLIAPPASLAKSRSCLSPPTPLSHQPRCAGHEAQERCMHEAHRLADSLANPAFMKAGDAPAPGRML